MLKPITLFHQLTMASHFEEIHVETPDKKEDNTNLMLLAGT